MPGELDPIYIRARSVLLDALEALGEQRKAAVLVGAQAIYLQLGETDLAVSPFTEDADLALSPSLLVGEPPLGEAMRLAGFDSKEPGVWLNPDGVAVDLLVPESLAGPGRRGARLSAPHGKRVARKVKGLEAVLIDNSTHLITALESEDQRQYDLAVASPAALLVAKLHKIAERVASEAVRRRVDKDALDILRILQGTETATLSTALARLKAHSIAGPETMEALAHLHLFGTGNSLGTKMAVRATRGIEDEDFISASITALSRDLLRAIDE